MKKTVVLCLLVGLVSLTLIGCGGSSQDNEPTLVVGAIPDQNVSELNRRFGLLIDYLEDETGINIDYNRSSSYAALVTAFGRNEVHLGWFGGLTGVQARAAVPGSKAIAQRKRDQTFHSKFIARTDLNVNELSDLQGKTFTFGSESSTSGHLMPRHFMKQQGIIPEDDFNNGANYSGSHDKTWKLVESNAFQAGVLNEAVWNRAVRENQVDTSKVQAFHTTPPYYDYNWTIHGDVNEKFGDGTKQAIQEALVNLENEEILGLFVADTFIKTKNENYQPIKDVAVELGLMNK